MGEKPQGAVQQRRIGIIQKPHFASMKFLATTLLASLLVGSCASKQDVGSLEKRFDAMEQQNSATSDEIRKNQARIEATIVEIRTNVLAEIENKQKRLDENQATILRNSADDREDHHVISNRINKVNGSLDETIHHLKLEEESLKKVELELRDTHNSMMESFMTNGQKIESLQKQLNELFGAITAQIEELKQATAKAPEGKKKKEKAKPAKDTDTESKEDSPKTTGATKSSQQAKKGSSSPEALYNSAYDDFLKGKFSQAQSKFSEFVKRYPDSELSYNSQYWIGEALANQDKLKEAVEAFNLTAANYPKSTKAPAALLRAGEILEKTGTPEDVRAILTKIHDNYPASYEAVMADEKLKKLKEQSKQE